MKVDPDLTVAPVICYESVFGDYVGDFIRKGANLVAVITNDGWWGNTDGYRQHFVYAKLRAIEVRRSIARSANTGISGFIRPNGEVVKATPYWEKRAQVHQLPILNTMTFYARYGDYLGYTGAGVAVLLILLAIVRRMGLSLLSVSG
jgi:apolipoprotein N-acyltransferase